MCIHEIFGEKLFAPERMYRTASSIFLFESGFVVFSSSIAFQNALDHVNQTITSKVTCLVQLYVQVHFTYTLFSVGLTFLYGPQCLVGSGITSPS